MLVRLGSRLVVVAWTLVCVVGYVLVEVLGETFVDQSAAILGTTLASALGFLHDLGMILLVLVWLIVAWGILTLGSVLGGRRAPRRWN